MKLLKHITIFTLFLLLGSCTTNGLSTYQPHLKDFKKESDFFSSKLLEHGVTVVGLTGQYSEITVKERDDLNSILFYYLGKKLDQKKVSYVIFTNDEQIESKDITEINLDTNQGKKIVCVVNSIMDFTDTANRYLIYYTLNDNKTEHSTYTTDDYRHFVSSRTVDITMHVYDQLNETIVWEGTLANTEKNEKKNSLGNPEEGDSFGEGLLRSLLTSVTEAIKDGIAGQYADYPTFFETGSYVMIGFVNNLIPVKPEIKESPEPYR